MEHSKGQRSVRYGLMLMVLFGWLGYAQENLGAISFSIFDDTDIVHVSKIGFQIVTEAASVTSTLSVTQRSELRLGVGESLQRTLFLSNETARPQEYFVVLIVDDHQVEFELDGKRAKTHALSLEPNAQLRMPIRFPALKQEGLHNFVLLVFYDVLINESNLLGMFTPYSDSLIIGADAVPQVSVAKPQEESFSQGRPSQANQAVLPRGVSLSRSEAPSSQQDLLTTPLNVDADQVFAFHIYIRNGLPRQGEADEFALIALWDGVQVPIDSNSPDPVVYFRLPDNGLINISARLEIPKDTGRHRLDILAVRNPYNVQGGMGSLEVLHTHLRIDVN